MAPKASLGLEPLPFRFQGGGANDDMRLAASNLALVIEKCGLSQSELSRQSGVSRQLINAWARQRVSITLSTTIAQLLKPLGLKLTDLLVDPAALLAKLGRPAEPAPEAPIAFPHIMATVSDPDARKRVEALHGSFLFRTRIKEAAYLIIEVTFEFDAYAEPLPVVRVYEGRRASRNPLISGHYFYHASTFYLFGHHLTPPHYAVVYTFWDPMSDRLTSLRGVSIAPEWFGEHRGKPLARQVFMHRVDQDGRPLAEPDFDPDAEFVDFIPADGVSVIKSY